MPVADTVSVEQLRVWLTEAENAHQRLLLGKSVRAIIDSNGERVEFTHASADKLRARILELQRRIDAAAGDPPSRTLPIGFCF